MHHVFAVNTEQNKQSCWVWWAEMRFWAENRVPADKPKVRWHDYHIWHQTHPHSIHSAFFGLLSWFFFSRHTSHEPLHLEGGESPLFSPRVGCIAQASANQCTLLPWLQRLAHVGMDNMGANATGGDVFCNFWEGSILSFFWEPLEMSISLVLSKDTCESKHPEYLLAARLPPRGKTTLKVNPPLWWAKKRNGKKPWPYCWAVALQ